jgi:hypothetical protein
MNGPISEKIIEDILTNDKSILAEILSLSAPDLSLLARQKPVRSGKLDLLYLFNDELLLIELKVVGFYEQIIEQINEYHKDLTELQKQNKLISSQIKKAILVTDATASHFEACKKENIKLFIYKPETVLSKFYENFKELSYFLKIQSGDYGMVRLGLLNSTLKLLGEGFGIKEICKIESKSEKTIRNRISVARLLNLVVKHKNEYYLTDLGNRFNELRENMDGRLSQAQIELLSDFISESPYFSSITYTILSLIETVFVLSKNFYPVLKDAVKDYFVKSVGKTTTWKTEKARETATYVFSNYACELELLVKINNQFYLSPKGIQAILLLQLNRSIKLIGSRN